MKLPRKGSLRDDSVLYGGPACYGSYAVTKRIALIDSTVNLKGKSVLDLGCGNGSYTVELATRAASVYGVDILLPNLRAFRVRIPRFQAAGENLPFASETFDAITMIEVLEHTRCDSNVLEECFRVLKPGGSLVLFVPNKLYPFESHPCHVGNFSLGPNIPFVSWLPRSLRKHVCHARIYTRHELLTMTQRAGFQIQQTGYIFPPLDSLRLPFRQTYRKLARWLERTPLCIFGVSIYSVFLKPVPVQNNPQAEPVFQLAGAPCSRDANHGLSAKAGEGVR